MLDRTIHTLHIPQNVGRGPGVLLRVFVAHGTPFASGSLFECLADELTFPSLSPFNIKLDFFSRTIPLHVPRSFVAPPQHLLGL